MYRRGLTLVPHSSRKCIQPFRSTLSPTHYQTAMIDALLAARNWNLYFNWSISFNSRTDTTEEACGGRAPQGRRKREKWPFQAGG
jgi:hypothetical protein